MLRAAAETPWIRFHSLPDSKRYPETAEERRIVLSRQTALGDAVLGDGEPCWIAVCLWGPGPGRGMLGPDLSPLGLELAYGFQEPDDPEAQRAAIYAARTIWHASSFTGLLLEMAEDRGPRALWFSHQRGAVFAPYDGGVDIFAGRDGVEALRLKYSGWLSSHPAGL